MSEPDRSTYELVTGSDVADRDGMYLEINDGPMETMQLTEVFIFGHRRVDDGMHIRKRHLT